MAPPVAALPRRHGRVVRDGGPVLRGAPLQTSLGLPRPARRAGPDPKRHPPSVREAMTWTSAWNPVAGPVNITARLVAVVALGLGTILVARVGGAEDVGLLALLRVVPGLFGVLAACGLPGAMGYFLAGPHRAEARLWPTILALLAAGVGLGIAVWFLLMYVIQALLFPTTDTLVMVLAGVSVGTQLPLAVAKSSLQGLDDRRGSNLVTGAEEAAFIPAFAAAYLLGLRGPLL